MAPLFVAPLRKPDSDASRIAWHLGATYVISLSDGFMNAKIEKHYYLSDNHKVI